MSRAVVSAERVQRLHVAAIWAMASAVAWFFAMLLGDSANVGGFFVPQGNDSFYHARRILDAAAGTEFYQFDPRLHAPEGRVVPWPWLYDYSMALVARAALWLRPDSDPLGIVFYVPVVWILINAALLLAVTGELRLSIEMRAIAMLCFALSPFTQLLHAYGMIDHHFIEHTFVLLTVWLGLRWFNRPDDAVSAGFLGFALGIAPGAHTGLFILQLLPLACILILWARGQPPSSSALKWFAGALVGATQLVLWPSATFRAGSFDFGLLSWFHLYVAVSTSVLVLCMAKLQRSLRGWLTIALVALLLAVPVAAQALRGLAFIGGEISVLDTVVEAQSVLAQLTGSFGVATTVSFYTWLLLLVPLLFGWYAYRVATERDPGRLYYGLAVVMGLALMTAQFRFHYFGFFALVTGVLVIVDSYRAALTWHRGAVVAGVLLGVVLAYQPALRARLFESYLPGIDASYAATLPLYLQLASECEQNPAVVLARNNDGNPILFHTNCNVITNNFILSREDDENIQRVSRLLTLPPAQFRQAAPEVRYVLLRRDDFTFVDRGQAVITPDAPLAAALLLSSDVPAGFELISDIRRGEGESGAGNVYAKLFKVVD